MKKLTTDDPQDNIQMELNLFYIKNDWTWVRGGGPAPEYADVNLCDYVREIIKTHVPYVDLDMDDDGLSMMMDEWLFDGPESIEGLIATLYVAAWAFAELRHRLAAYEDTGLEPDKIEAQSIALAQCKPYIDALCDEHGKMIINPIRLRELVQAEQDGRLVVIPCKVGDMVYLTGGDCVIEAEVTCIRPFVFRDKTEFRGNAVWRLEDPFYNDGRILEQDMFIVFGKNAYLTREEAEAALKGETNETDPV